MGNNLSGMNRPVDASDDVLAVPLPISLRVTLRNG
jgi:hypothetical protein